MGRFKQGLYDQLVTRSATLDEDERAKLRTFGLQTKSYICFCTLLDEFSNEDEDYFKQLYRDGVKIILLSGKLLLADREAVSEFHVKNRGRSENEADWLSRQTIRYAWARIRNGTTSLDLIRLDHEFKIVGTRGRSEQLNAAIRWIRASNVLLRH